MFSKEVLQIVRRLQEARLSLMRKQPFYAVLLLHMQFSIDPMCETAYTDRERIVFCPDFINTLSDSELEFVLMHEVLHAALNHCGRSQESYDFDDFNTACDIVVNSNILYSFNMDLSKITLKDYGESMHLAPDGKEGYLYAVEDVYHMIRAKRPVALTGGGKADPDSTGGQDGSDGKNEDGKDDTGKNSGKGNNGKGKNKSDKSGKSPDGAGGSGDGSAPARTDGGFDDHTYWGQVDDDGDGGEASEDRFSKSELQDAWLPRMIEATDIAAEISIRQGSNACGRTPLGAQRIVNELTRPQTDWRTVLDTFIQEEITDYSFNPPDRRFQDSPFLLPDYNEKDESVKDLLFMIDTSGSMSDKMITQAYSEIYGAIQQFNGRLQGWLGFFDAAVVAPKRFTDEDELRIIRPKGGGGTSFHCIFNYVKEHLDEIEPTSIIILTDGYAQWPDENDAMGIPVLWLINNEEAQPPWGKVTRIKIEE